MKLFFTILPSCTSFGTSSNPENGTNTRRTKTAVKQLSEGCWNEICSKGQRSRRTDSQPLQPHMSSCYRDCNLGTAEAWTSLLLSLLGDLSLLSLYKGFSCPLRTHVPSCYFPCTVCSSASAQRCPWSEGDTHQLDEAFNLHLNHLESFLPRCYHCFDPNFPAAKAQGSTGSLA